MNRDEAGTIPVSPVGWALLTAACDASGITPDSDSTGTLARLASGDFETCAVVAALIRRAYRAGCTSAAVPAPDTCVHLTARRGAA
jgi:hypothetical protein